MNLAVSKEKMLEGIHKMNSFGTRLTGSKGHTDFINYLKDEITKMDLPIFSDTMTKKVSLIRVIINGLAVLGIRQIMKAIPTTAMVM